MATINQTLRDVKAVLKSAGVESFALDAELLLTKATGLSRVELVTRDFEAVAEEQLEEFLKLSAMRAEGIPLKYIVQSCEFMSLSFFVDKRVLIPRPDTELLAENIILAAKTRKRAKILDIGTGSGALAVAAAFYTDAEVTALDVSDDALEVARMNSESNGTDVKFVRFDILNDNFYGFGFENYDIIASNPPYIKTDDLEGLSREVLCEPRLALDGGADGLVFYRRISEFAVLRLAENGLLMFEIGFDQADGVEEIMKKQGFNDITILNDLAGLNRMVIGKKR